MSSAGSEKAETTFREKELARRTTNALYERTSADKYTFENTRKDLVVLKGGQYLDQVIKIDEFQLIDRLLVEGMTNENQLEDLASSLDLATFNIHEVWLDDKTDVYNLLYYIYHELLDRIFPNYIYFQKYINTNRNICSRETTIYVPESQLSKALKYLDSSIIHPVYSIKAYKGDVYQAIKNHSAYDFCQKHLYTAAIQAADRVYQYGNCDHGEKYYYSCTHCGKCEKNPKHLFLKVENGPKILPVNPMGYGHDYADYVADDDHYIGKNAAGQHVYWMACTWCGSSYRQDEIKTSKSEVKRREELALVDDKPGVGMFVTSRKSTAKVSKAAQSGVNFALSVNLVDEALLGNDYTVTATRAQLIAIAVRLAEELTGKEVSKGSGYSDAKDVYAQKASKMGLTDDFAATKLSPDTKVTRQEMATVIYRALRYVEKNSEYAYTDYDSKLNTYTDKSLLKQWAVEPMAFMNALGLIKGTTATTLSPDAPCAIETALDVAYNSTFAHTLGWYQAEPGTPVHGTTWISSDPSVKTTPIRYGLNDRIWVIGPPIGVRDEMVPITEPYTGRKIYIKSESFHPLRWRGGDPMEMYKAHREAHTVKSKKNSDSSSSTATKKAKTKAKQTTKKAKQKTTKQIGKSLRDLIR